MKAKQVLDEVLPTCAVSVEAWQDLPAAPLFPIERRLISRAVEKRQREFATARNCAHRALKQLGAGVHPIGMGEHGEPLWPPGVIGSLTHCDGYRAAAVASVDRLRGLGIDAEPHLPLPSGLLDSIAEPGEIRALAELRCTRPEVHWDRLTFSAKESIYKAWFPLTRQRPEFHDASLIFDPGSQAFSARLTFPGPTPGELQETVLAGRWLTNDRHVLTAVALAHPGQTQGPGWLTRFSWMQPERLPRRGSP